MELTLFDLLDRPDHVVDEALHVAEGIRDARRLVNLRKRRVKDGDDVLEQIRRDALIRPCQLGRFTPL
jgi:hypothetical protein